jgi:iron complex outermembrane recepter protein
MKASYRLGLSAVALLGAQGAYAQQATPPAGDAAPPEIVVTAERRATNVQRTAVAATVLTADDLRKKSVNGVDQLQFASPSLTVNNAGQGNNFNIRGIGEATRGSAFSVGVVTYRDGVATFPGYFQTEPYYDIASVEVLRGPQGTFAGGNATGGAVFVGEANPVLGRIGGYASAQYGNYNDAKLEGAINLPLTDTLAIRLATDDERRDTFYHITGPWTGNPGNLRSYNGRISLLWQPDSHWRVLIKGDYSNVNSGGYPGDPAIAADRPVPNNDLFDISSDAYLNGKDEQGRVSANISYTTDDGIVFRSITGYQKGTTQASLDADGTYNPYVSSTLSDFIHERIWSEEFNVVSPDRGPFTWLLGGYYQNDLITIPQGNGYLTGLSEATPFGTVSITDSLYGTNPKTALAGFGQVGYKFTEALQLQVGARWSRTTARNDAWFSFPQYGVTNYPQHSSTANDSLTGKIALNWTVDHNQFLYAFVATGAKAGGVNSPNLIAPPTNFGQERVTDYELGWKATWLGGQLHTQLGGYYNRYTQFQVSVVDPVTPLFATILNVPTASQLYGAEFSAQGKFGAFGLDLAAAYEHTALGTLYAEDSRVAVTTATCNLANGPATGSCLNLTGMQQPYAPKLTLNAGAQYMFTLGGGFTLTPRVDFSHTSAVWATIFENAALGDYINPRNLMNVQLTLDQGPWSIAGYATNVTNQHYVAAIDQLTVPLRRAGAPRQFGIRVNRSF